MKLTTVLSSLTIAVSLMIPGLADEFAIANEPVLTVTVGTEAPHPIRSLIDQLDSDHYHTRQSAKTDLIRLTNQGNADSLHQGLKHHSLEVRSTVAEILGMIRQRDFDDQLQEVSDPNVPTEELTSSGWKEFSAVAGTDMEARLAFVAVCRRHPVGLSSIQSVSKSHFDFTNPFQISSDDGIGWVLLLLSELRDKAPEDEFDTQAATQSSRIAMSLSQPTMGLDLHAMANHPSGCGVVFSRLVAIWLAKKDSVIDRRTAIRVATRYRCDEVAKTIAEQVLRDPSSPAASTVTAMLVMTNLLQENHWLSGFVNDNRTAHVWQLIADRKIKIQTQVRDVAIALLVNQAGHDPRQFGFAYLEADPLLRFRDYSLGFENDQLRALSHTEALNFLSTNTTSPVMP
jgi:hypothetical protein